MKSYFDILNKYQIKKNNLSFSPQDFSQGDEIGQISSGIGTLRVFLIIDGDQRSYGAVVNDPSVPVGFLSFQSMDYDMFMSRNAWTDPRYTGKGIQSELFHFVSNTTGVPIFSDLIMSNDGAALWASMTGSGKFQHKIVNIASMQLFDFSEIGDMADDGVAGQRYFFALMPSTSYPLEEGSDPYSGFMHDRHGRLKLVQAGYRYFKDGSP